MIIRLLLLAIFAFLGYTLYTALRRSLPGGKVPPRKTSQGEELVRDPVCGTFIPRSSAVTRVVGGTKYHFCSTRCRDEFAGKKPPSR